MGHAWHDLEGVRCEVRGREEGTMAQTTTPVTRYFVWFLVDTPHTPNRPLTCTQYTTFAFRFFSWPWFRTPTTDDDEGENRNMSSEYRSRQYRILRKGRLRYSSMMATHDSDGRLPAPSVRANREAFPPARRGLPSWPFRYFVDSPQAVRGAPRRPSWLARNTELVKPLLGRGRRHTFSARMKAWHVDGMPACCLSWRRREGEINQSRRRRRVGRRVQGSRRLPSLRRTK